MTAVIYAPRAPLSLQSRLGLRQQINVLKKEGGGWGAIRQLANRFSGKCHYHSEKIAELRLHSGVGVGAVVSSPFIYFITLPVGLKQSQSRCIVLFIYFIYLYTNIILQQRLIEVL